MDWINWAIGIAIGVAAVGIALDNVFSVDQSGWDTGSIALWALLGIAIVGGFITMVYKPHRE